MKHSVLRIAAWLGSAGLGLGLAGCGPSRDMTHARAFPQGTARVGSVDAQALIYDRSIEITNTTERDFGAGTVWLNRWYSQPIEGLGVGERVRLPLRDFRDRYGERIREGGFFATEAPERVVVAELEVAREDGRGEEMVGLIVVTRRTGRER